MHLVVDDGDINHCKILSREQAEKDRMQKKEILRNINNEKADDPIVDESRFDRTVWASVKAKEAIAGYAPPSETAPYGYYYGRRILGRDMPINDSVYIGSSDREAIVIDDGKDEPLKQSFIDFLHQRKEKVFKQVAEKNIVKRLLKNFFPRQKEKRIITLAQFQKGILNDVFSYVRDVMPNNADEVNKIEKEIKALSKSKKIYLGSYINRQAGVCRHEGLFAGYLLEKLINNGYLKGSVSVDRNKVIGKGAHAWCRYTDKNNEIFILDPAQNFNGRLKNAGKNQWKYARPEDIAEGKAERS